MAKQHRYEQPIFEYEYELAMKLTSQENAFFQLLSLQANSKTNRVKPDSDEKKAIMEKLGSTSEDPVRMANKIINKLIEKDVMKRVERGSFLLNPKFRHKQNNTFSYTRFEVEYGQLD
uniref:Plasmid replication protein RepL domain-containing protein n=1 Tax=uncultured Thiotrichaceae bacterium TaxID=298394 RepID=A0A6S6U3A6_9GAMM|nr:MAG: Unknown protein [uncultured Thiotrichaceae bacterium]